MSPITWKPTHEFSYHLAIATLFGVRVSWSREERGAGIRRGCGARHEDPFRHTSKRIGEEDSAYDSSGMGETDWGFGRRIHSHDTFE
jgi:hypothetical protein